MMTRSKQSNNANSDNNPILDLFAEGVNITTKQQLVDIVGQADLNDILFAIIGVHKASLGRVAELEAKVHQLESEVSELGDRALRQEAYSGRNTVILAGLPETKDETPAALEKGVVAVLKKADPTISPSDIGIVHRNAKRKSGPRTVTCVLTRASKKDSVMKKESRDKVKRDAKVACYHWSSPGLRKRKEELEKVQGVKWVAFSGHRLFTVCLDLNGKETFLKSVLSVQDIQSAT